MKKKFSTQKGFSLIELVMYMGILSILLFMLTDILTSTLNVRAESQTNSSIVQDGRFLVARLAYDIERAESISIPAVPGDTSNSLQISLLSISNTYSLSNGQLILQNNTGSNVLNSIDTTISNLTFKRIGNVGGKNSIQINFTVNSTTQRASGFETKNYQTTIALR